MGGNLGMTAARYTNAALSFLTLKVLFTTPDTRERRLTILLNYLHRLRGSAIGRGAGCCVNPTSGCGPDFLRRQAKPSSGVDELVPYLPRKATFWLVHRRPTTSHSMCRIRIQIASTKSRRSEMRGADQRRLISAAIYRFSIYRERSCSIFKP